MLVGGATSHSLYNEVWILNLKTLHSERLDVEGGFESRYEHSAFMPKANEAKVWVFGGANTQENKNDLWEVDLDKLEWNKLPQMGDVPSERTYHTTTTSKSHKSLLISKYIDCLMD